MQSTRIIRVGSLFLEPQLASELNFGDNNDIAMSSSKNWKNWVANWKLYAKTMATSIHKQCAQIVWKESSHKHGHEANANWDIYSYHRWECVKEPKTRLHMSYASVSSAAQFASNAQGNKIWENMGDVTCKYTKSQNLQGTHKNVMRFLWKLSTRETLVLEPRSCTFRRMIWGFP